MKTSWQLLLGGVGLTKCKVKNLGPALKGLCEELDTQLKAQAWLKGAPFNCVSMVVRYGSISQSEPEIEPINTRASELPVAVYWPIENHRISDSPQELAQELKPIVIKGLQAVSAKFNLEPPNVA